MNTKGIDYHIDKILLPVTFKNCLCFLEFVKASDFVAIMLQFCFDTGQTYQETNRTYQKLHEAHGKKPIRATVTLVEGVETDYITSGILASDCKFSSFEVPSLVHLNP
jgi:hypothetical protein